MTQGGAASPLTLGYVVQPLRGIRLAAIDRISPNLELLNLGYCVARPESSKGVENRSHALPCGPGRATQEILPCAELSSPDR